MKRAIRPTTEARGAPEDVFARHEPLHIRYAPDELIFQAGTYAAGVYLVVEGIVHESYVDAIAGGDPVSTGLYGPVSLIGVEMYLPGGEHLHRSSCRAVSQVSLSFLEQNDFEAALEMDEALQSLLMAHYAQRGLLLARAVWRSQLDPAGRVQALLQDLACLGRPIDGSRVALPKEIDLHRVADLSYITYRKAKQLCRALDGAKWDGEQWLLAPEACTNATSNSA